MKIYIVFTFLSNFFRLDCGTGPGVVRSNSKVILNQWNDLAVNRHDWGVWIQLNKGPREEGRSQVRKWNDLSVNRHDWGVWIQLNKGPREQGRGFVNYHYFSHEIKILSVINRNTKMCLF